MGRLHTDIEKMWWSDNKPNLLLRAASHIYSGISRTHLYLRKKRAATPDIPVISVGNITAGGSGKTPFVIWLCEQLKHAGFKPVVICRGDGGKSGPPQILSGESEPRIVGDEAVLLYNRCNVPVIAGHNRIRAAHMAAEYGDIAILDDGFQYRQLERVCDIVLIPAEGVGNGHPIPAGPLREPVQALQRADLIVRTGERENSRPLSDGREWYWRTTEKELVQVKGAPAEPPTAAMAITAIARPERFVRSLERLGVQVEDSKFFPDHHPFTSTDIEESAQQPLPIMITAKDAVKLDRIWPEDRELWILEQQAEAEPCLFEAILDVLRQREQDVSD